MKWVRAIAGIAVAASVVFGWKFYSKFNTARHLKNYLLAACAQDSQCDAAINKHFNRCFDTHYNLGSRHRTSSLDGPQFITCINDNADQPYFKE